MISRYTRPELHVIWSDARRLQLFLEVELCACAALEEAPHSPIPPGTTSRLRALAAETTLTPRRVEELEQRTHHELLAFLQHVEELLGDEARYLHFGLTSSDVLDTALALQLVAACDVILHGLRQALLPALRAQAEAHRDVPMIGRSHGIHAEPIACGLVFLGSYAELERAAARIERARAVVAVGKLSGAVGVYGSGGMSPEVEARALGRLGLAAETVATQVVARDRHAELVLSLALLGAAVERLAVNLRHLQRTEVGEVEEAFAPGQKGSSAMPHKKNPISAENLCGLARLLRSYANPAIEDIALWHERDISHSSVERLILPDATTLADYLVQRAARLVRGLRVRPAQIARNLGLGGDLFGSEKVMLKLVESGLSRRAAYEKVQEHALAAVESRHGGGTGSLKARLLADPEVTARLAAAELASCFDVAHHLRHVPAIFDRALGPADEPTDESADEGRRG